ncbi:MAG: hypothetical protein SWX82_09130 [Cyanobacteriota bacterium]|nr:hypothetical protein [Cyanobacteriota bacterium]
MNSYTLEEGRRKKVGLQNFLRISPFCLLPDWKIARNILSQHLHLIDEKPRKVDLRFFNSAKYLNI